MFKFVSRRNFFSVILYTSFFILHRYDKLTVNQPIIKRRCYLFTPRNLWINLIIIAFHFGITTKITAIFRSFLFLHFFSVWCEYLGRPRFALCQLKFLLHYLTFFPRVSNNDSLLLWVRSRSRRFELLLNNNVMQSIIMCFIARLLLPIFTQIHNCFPWHGFYKFVVLVRLGGY